MQIVDLNDARDGDERAPDSAGVKPLGCGLEEHAAGGLQQQIRRACHQPRDAQRRDRIGALKAGEQDHCGGERGADEAIQVGQQVLKTALHAQAPLVGVGEHPRGDEVDEHAQQRESEHEAGAYGRRGEQAADRLVGYERGEDQQAHAVGLRGQDLDALVAERERAFGGPGGESEGHEREAERGGVGEHVACV